MQRNEKSQMSAAEVMEEEEKEMQAEKHYETERARASFMQTNKFVVTNPDDKTQFVALLGQLVKDRVKKWKLLDESGDAKKKGESINWTYEQLFGENSELKAEEKWKKVEIDMDAIIRNDIEQVGEEKYMEKAELAKEHQFKGDFEREQNIRKQFWGIETALDETEKKKPEDDLKKIYNIDKNEHNPNETKYQKISELRDRMKARQRHDRQKQENKNIWTMRDQLEKTKTSEIMLKIMKHINVDRKTRLIHDPVY